MWARWANAILGTWLALSAWVLSDWGDYRAIERPGPDVVVPTEIPQRETNAMSWNNVITGFIIIGCAVAAMFPAYADLRWVNLAAGFWTLISPSLIPHNLAAITTSNVITGILVMLASLVPLYQEYREGGWGRRDREPYRPTTPTTPGTPTV